MTEDGGFASVDGPGPGDTEPVRTGVADIDAVIVAVEELEDRPVAEHVGVFERAHEQLRRALDSQPSQPNQPSPSQPRRPGPS